MSRLLHIVADENIPCVESLFSTLGRITLLPGRQISKHDVQHADVLLVRSVTQVNEALLQNSSVRFVGSTTIGVDHVDQAYLASKSIPFAYAPGSNARSVVEFVISAIWALRERIGPLAHKRLAIIGFGNVGQGLAKVATALGLEVMVCDPLVPVDARYRFVDLEQALAADIISFHTPLTVDTDYPTRHLLNADNLSLIKTGAMLINTSRGAVVDNQALLQRLEQQQNLLTVMDVWENEPAISQRLKSLVDIATPHIAGYSLDGKLAGVKAVYKDLCHFLDVDVGNPNLPMPIPDSLELTANCDWESVLGRLFVGAYDIMTDDRRLRMALDGLEGADAAEAFDSLRKSYPVRREWRAHSVIPRGVSTMPQQRLLEELGFQLCL